MLLETLLSESCVIEPTKLGDKEVFIVGDYSKNSGKIGIIKRPNEVIINFKVDNCGRFSKNFGTKKIDNIIFWSVIKNRNSTNMVLFIEFKSHNKTEIYNAINKFEDFFELTRNYLEQLKEKGFKLVGLIVHSNREIEEEVNATTKVAYTMVKSELEFKIEGIKVYYYYSFLDEIEKTLIEKLDKQVRQFLKSKRIYKNIPIKLY